ncbi:nicotinate-nucleotide diphosphorylase (carboxylating) [Ammoniphilus oxalaticus]|uniref:Probable nicotinate-nucleotide pyrophosphorylase [carboxylating] n=1 Tax=Ammoniphilus oxalaticus TaxID=66863 RepID=A0A419SG77_9BACL|nr:carboxylating nicotinate-nucleotide diphosphorylase [Ammoniphilus oxalaticus]RKD22780.1 nicotinate-nucleotide diphosphorylase (carboxylating) [Ammoniphilus oxalaticus]
MMINSQLLNRQIEAWLEEDVGYGDISAQATVPAQAQATGMVYSKASGHIAGLWVAQRVFETVDPNLIIRVEVEEGQQVDQGALLMTVEGAAQSILTGERLALNLLQRLSGIATLTARYVAAARQGHPQIRVVDTRKTMPGLRMLDKYAVRMGGGHNHRFGLDDAVMIKDNHIKAAGGISAAISAARDYIPHTMKIEVEVESIEQVRQALAARADIIMLDNMDVETMIEAVNMIGKQAIIEASGGIDLDTIRSIAATGVDVISVGAITHSVSALDISLDLNQRKG